MSKLSQTQIYTDAKKVGFTAAQAKVMAAIAMAESGGDPTMVGDVNLEDATWGPSVGLTQVRTLKAETGTGGIRDINTLATPMANLKAAYDISNHGTNWQPWTAYTNGTYKQFLDTSVTATPPVTPADVAYNQYVVKPGDNLTTIAMASQTTVAKLVAVNHLSDPDHIEVGQTLRLAPGKPFTSPDNIYTVNPGDNLTTIAAAHRTTVAKLVALNHLVNPDHIVVGQTLKLAAAEPAAPPTRIYTVVPGDNLTTIAAAHQTTVTKLVALNSLVNPDLIVVGQTLKIA